MIINRVYSFHDCPMWLVTVTRARDLQIELIGSPVAGLTARYKYRLYDVTESRPKRNQSPENRASVAYILLSRKIHTAEKIVEVGREILRAKCQNALTMTDMSEFFGKAISPDGDPEKLEVVSRTLEVEGYPEAASHVAYLRELLRDNPHPVEV